MFHIAKEPKESKEKTPKHRKKRDYFGEPLQCPRMLEKNVKMELNKIDKPKEI